VVAVAVVKQMLVVAVAVVVALHLGLFPLQEALLTQFQRALLVTLAVVLQTVVAPVAQAVLVHLVI
jgi:hypothetical protein